MGDGRWKSDAGRFLFVKICAICGCCFRVERRRSSPLPVPPLSKTRKVPVPTPAWLYPGCLSHVLFPPGKKSLQLGSLDVFRVCTSPKTTVSQFFMIPVVVGPKAVRAVPPIPETKPPTVPVQITSEHAWCYLDKMSRFPRVNPINIRVSDRSTAVILTKRNPDNLSG